MKRIAHRLTTAALGVIVVIGLLVQTTASGTDLSQLKLFGKWTAPPSQFNLGDVHTSTALSSKWAVVGCWSANDRGAANEGGVQVFNAATGAWVRKLLPPGAATANQFFGYAVALSGDTLVVGAHGTNTGNGKVHIFNLATGALIRSTPNPSNNANQFFGSAVAISGDYLVVGAYGDSTMLTNAGRVEVFSLSTGALFHTIRSFPAVGNSTFGSALAIEGNILAVGAPGENLKTGKVYFYSLAPLRYAAIRTLVPSGAVANTFAGACLAMFQGRVVIGTNFSGKAFLYDLATGFEHTLVPVSPAGDGSFGNSVAINHAWIAVGQRFAEGNRGAVHLFNSAGFEEDTINSPSSVRLTEEKFGASVCMDGNTLLATAPEDSTQDIAKAGAAYLIKPLTGPMNYFKIAAKGDYAPGAANINYGTIGDVYVNRSSETSFLTSLTGTGALATDRAGFQTGLDGRPILVAKTGASAGSGLRVSGVSRLLCNDPDLWVNQVTLSGISVNSTNNSVLMIPPGPVLRTGTIYPELGGAPSAFLDLVQPQVTGEGRFGCPITLRIGVNGVTSADDSGVLIAGVFAPAFLAMMKEGGTPPASMGAGVVLGQFAPRLCYVNRSQFYSAALTGSSVSTTNNTVVLGRTAAGAQSVVARKGDTAVDALDALMPGVTYSSFIGEASNSLETAFYRATVTGAPSVVTVANNEGIWAYNTAFSIRRLMVRKGSILDDVTYAKIARIISFWGTGNTASVEQALVLVQLTGQTINSSNDQALLLVQSDNDSVRLIMREGDAAQGCPGAKIGVISRVESDPISHTYAVLTTLAGAAPGTDQALFIGNVERGDTLSGFDLRRPFLRLRKGQLFDNQPSKIKSISLPTTNIAASGAGSIGRGRAISDTSIVFTVEFDNGVRQIMQGPSD